jgi:NADH:ubiquinone oxidoreductase subunit D
VHQDLPPELLDDIWAFCDPFLKVCDDIEGLLTENRIFKQRNVGIAVVKLADAWSWGFSGAMVRGCGAAWDLRKAQPYECYSELDFDIPSSTVRSSSASTRISASCTAGPKKQRPKFASLFVRCALPTRFGARRGYRCRA